jgi:transcriptional regulator with XRE-family HTH domain
LVNRPGIMVTMVNTGSRIKKLRLQAGLSQRELVRDSGYSNAYLSRIESGDRDPSYRFLIAISEALDTTALYLDTGRHDAECPFCLHRP